ncbi:MAG: metal-dependent hydrolase [Acidimicrobiia bacterium]
MSSLTVRRPSFDLTGMRAVWAPHREWAHQINSANIIPTAIEPFLIKVMRRAKADLDPVADAELIDDIDLFNRQEAQHYKAHDLFVEMIAADGYPAIVDHDNKLKDEYDEFLRARDLEWLLGYCEGFEALAAAGAHVWVDGGWGEYLQGADPRGVALWRWHLAEEYEHRTVVHRLFHRLSTGTPAEVYAKRIATFQFAVEHIRGATDALLQYLLGVDRSSMTVDERAASEARSAAVAERFAANQAGVAAVFLDSWDPTVLPKPELLDEVLSQY